MNGKDRYLGTLTNGEQVWIPQHVIDRVDGTLAGTYEVYGFDSEYTRDGETVRGFGLRNAQ